MRMTDEEIRVAALEKLTDERIHAGAVTETTPLDIDAAVRAFAESLGGEPPIFVPVVEDPLGRYGWCNEGVRLKVEAAGGTAVYGWTIWEWAPVLLTAEFHGVWRSPMGELVDITPKPRREGRIVFVADPAYPADLDFDDRPRNRRMNIYGPAIRAKRLTDLTVRLTDSQRLYETKRAEKAGLSLDDWLSRKTAPDAISDAVDDLIKAVDAFEAHYDSLGASGHVAVDHTFVVLHNKRLAAQKRMRALLKGL